MNREDKILQDLHIKLLKLGFVEDTVYVRAKDGWITIAYEDRQENTELILAVHHEFRGYKITWEKLTDSRKKDLTKA